MLKNFIIGLQLVNKERQLQTNFKLKNYMKRGWSKGIFLDFMKNRKIKKWSTFAGLDSFTKEGWNFRDWKSKYSQYFLTNIINNLRNVCCKFIMSWIEAIFPRDIVADASGSWKERIHQTLLPTFTTVTHNCWRRQPAFLTT